MRKVLICALALYATSLQAQPMGKGTLPPVFPKDVAEKTQFDTRTRAYISPVRVMWMQNEELISGSENLLLQPLKEKDETKLKIRTTFSVGFAHPLCN